MAIFTQRVEIRADDGYVISNADVDWESMPQEANLERPGIRLISSTQGERRQATVNIDDYVELDNGDKDLSADFRKNYIKALHGQADNWKLMAVQIQYGYHVTLAFINVKTGREEDLYITTPPYLRIAFEKEQKDGTIDKYLLEVSSDRNGQQRSIHVTEIFPYGERVIHFENRFGDELAHPDKEWEYIYITEYR